MHMPRITEVHRGSGFSNATIGPALGSVRPETIGDVPSISPDLQNWENEIYSASDGLGGLGMYL